MDQGQRTCEQCGQPKDLDQFARKHSGGPVRSTICKTCTGAAIEAARQDQRHDYPPDTGTHRWCSECDQYQTMDQFSFERKTVKGDRSRKRICNPCRSQIRREKYHATQWDQIDGRSSSFPQDTDTERWCSGCEKYKPFDQFQKYGRRSIHAGYRFRKCKECSNSKRRETPQQWSNKHMTQEEFESQLQVQNGLCFLCGRPQTRLSSHGKVKRLAIDHDHLTGLLRKLLCDPCNQGLGLFQDDPELLRAAADYIEAHRRGTSLGVG